MKLILVHLIKCLSIVLMAGAITLELWHFQGVVAGSQQSVIPPVVSEMARFGLAVHGLEGILAAVYAKRQQRSPFFYAIYTFFVGTVGFIELCRRNRDNTNLESPCK